MMMNTIIDEFADLFNICLCELVSLLTQNLVFGIKVTNYSIIRVFRYLLWNCLIFKSVQ